MTDTSTLQEKIVSLLNKNKTLIAFCYDEENDKEIAEKFVQKGENIEYFTDSIFSDADIQKLRTKDHSVAVIVPYNSNPVQYGLLFASDYIFRINNSDIITLKQRTEL